MNASKHRIYHRMQLAAHRLQKVADRALLDAAGVTTSQAAVLAIIGGNTPITQNAVAKQLGVNESAMTAMVNRLQAMNLIEKVQSKMDARAWQLKLTATGRSTQQKTKKTFAALNARIEAVLPGDGIARLADSLAAIAAEFEAD